MQHKLMTQAGVEVCICSSQAVVLRANDPVAKSITLELWLSAFSFNEQVH